MILKIRNGGYKMFDLECDDMMEGEWGYCAADHRDCMDNRRTCKKADDYYHKQDGQHYYQRFVRFKERHYDKETGKFTYSYSLRDLQGKFKPVPLVNKEDADSLIDFLYQLCDKIDELGGYSECLNHK